MLLSLRGSEETSKPEITKFLTSSAKRYISSHFKVGKEDISMDWDAISIVVSTNHEMTYYRKKSIRDFLLHFGENNFRCGFPNKATGSSTADSVFGCLGNQSQHLPKLLAGNEMLVIDGPLKIAMHISCKKRLIECLQARRCYFSPASDLTGVCFDTSAAANKPNYKVMIDAIIESCEVDSTHIIHVADMGYRIPLTENDPMGCLFGLVKSMTDLDINVEIIQFDIAFSFDVEKDHVIQATCKKRKHDEISLLGWSSLKIHPTHKLPNLTDGPLRATDLEGTIEVKKNNWKNGKMIKIATVDDEELGPEECAETLLFAADTAENSNRNSVEVHSSTVHSAKGYGTHAHILNQRRNKYPMSPKAMYGAGRRSIESLQTLLNNLEFAANEAYEIIRSDGIQFRIEFSIRPHINDSFRNRGHFNDILLIVCIAARDFCGRHYNPQITTIHTRTIKTEIMKLLSEANSMVKFRQHLAFDQVYANPNSMVKFQHIVAFDQVYANEKASEWLRAHLSLLLITIGLCPPFNVKYIQSWLKDNQRFDPHSRAGSTLQSKCIQKQKKRMMKSLKKHLLRLKFSAKAANTLTEYTKTFPSADPLTCYKSLSMTGKHLLASSLWSDIIPHISGFLSKQKKGERQTIGQVRKRDEDSASLELETVDTSWSELKTSSDHILDAQIDNAPMPKHPLALAIFAHLKLSSLWNSRRPGFNRILCHFVLECHNSEKLSHGHIENQKTSQLLTNCAAGITTLTRDDFQYICVDLCMSGCGNRAAAHYQEQLCRKYKFPGSNEGTYNTCSHDNTRNNILNQVLSEDIVVPLSWNRTRTIFHRIADNTKISIARKEILLSSIQPAFSTIFITKVSTSNLYDVLAKSLNTHESSIRYILHNRLTKITDLQNCFLTDCGVTHDLFKGIINLHDLESKHGFLLSFSGNISQVARSFKFIPVIIMAMVCLVYQRRVTFYDRIEDKTYLFVYSESRSIIYEHQNTNVYSKHASLILTLGTNNTYEWNECKHRQDLQASIIPPNDLFVVGPLGGRTKVSQALNTVKNRRPQKQQNFYTALSKLLAELDSNYLENRDKNTDFFDLLPFLEELQSSDYSFGGFHKNAIDLCPHLAMPLGQLLSHIRKIPFHQWCHKIICPLTCMKHHNLTLAVFECINRIKVTYFYSFNTTLGQVECKRYDGGYTTLMDRPQVLYLYSNEKKAEHYSPISDEDQISQNNWHSDCSIIGKFSRPGTHNIIRYIDIFRERYLMSLFLDEDQMKNHDFRPEQPRTVLIPTKVICHDPKNLRQLMQMGITHHALILIFPCQQNEEIWEACIVHHPLQAPSSARIVLNTLTNRAPTHGTYTNHCVEGRKIDESESGYYILLYSYLGTNCSSVRQFKEAMHLVHCEEYLSNKVRLWTHQAVVNRGNNSNFLTPAWLEQMLPKPHVYLPFPKRS